jgi:hypothetical protein
MKIKYLAAALAAVAGLSLQQAKADLYSFDLGVPNGFSFTGPYVNVLVTTPTLNSTSATITFTSLSGSGGTYLMGGAQAADFNLNGTATITSNVATLTSMGSGTVDGFGVFNNTFDNFDGFSHAFSSVTFTLTNSSVVWANAMSVLIANASGWLAAAHIYPTLFSANTFFATGPGNPSVPDGGATVMLLGMGLGALGMVRRYLKS